MKWSTVQIVSRKIGWSGFKVAERGEKQLFMFTVSSVKFVPIEVA